MLLFEDFKSHKTLTFLAKGWRGEIYTFEESGKIYAIKKAIHSEAIYAIQKEANILTELYQEKTFPQIVCQGFDFFVYEYIDATPFEKVFWLLEEEKKRKILIDILKAAYKLDNMGINRGEFDKEYKNILIDDNLNTYILDFDRGCFSKKPKNITQFIQSLRVKGILPLELAINLGKIYKNQKEYVFSKLLDILSSPTTPLLFKN